MSRKGWGQSPWTCGNFCTCEVHDLPHPSARITQVGQLGLVLQKVAEAIRFMQALAKTHAYFESEPTVAYLAAGFSTQELVCLS